MFLGRSSTFTALANGLVTMFSVFVLTGRRAMFVRDRRRGTGREGERTKLMSFIICKICKLT